MESGLHSGVMGSHGRCVSRGHIRPVPHQSKPDTRRLPPQTSAACGFKMLMSPGTILKQLYTNSCGLDHRPLAIPATTRLKEVHGLQEPPRPI